MKNQRFWLGMLVMVLVFGMIVIGCNNGSDDSNSNDDNNSNSSDDNNSNSNGKTDPALNGTWLDTYEGIYAIPRLTNGTWGYINTPNQNGELKLDNGNFLSSINGSPYVKGTYTTGNGKITFSYTYIHGGDGTNGWYSIKEINDTNINAAYGYDQSFDYSIDGNKLIIDWTGGNVTTYIKR
jgi:hypothetical protein